MIINWLGKEASLNSLVWKPYSKILGLAGKPHFSTALAGKLVIFHRYLLHGFLNVPK